MTFGDFRGRAKRLDDIDLPAIGYRIGVGEDEIHAVLEVESRGSGFDPQGRPAMLFEPHVFWRELGNIAKRKEAVRLDIAYPKWGEKKYPIDSYPRLRMAMAIDETAALRSASWGLGQVMGFNFAAAGFSSPQAMVRAFMDDEETHLSAMVNFIKTARLDDELRARNWSGFARGYNGEGYAKHGYHTRLSAAFARWQKIKDTPWSPAMSAAETQARDPVAGHVVFFPEPKPQIPVIPAGERASPPDPGTEGRGGVPDLFPNVTDAPLPKPGFWSRLASALFRRIKV
jgi:hypothetical protein